MVWNSAAFNATSENSFPDLSIREPPEYAYCPIEFREKLYFSISPCPLLRVAVNLVTSSSAFLKNLKSMSLSSIPAIDLKYVVTSFVRSSMFPLSKETPMFRSDFLMFCADCATSASICGSCALICERSVPKSEINVSHTPPSNSVILDGSIFVILDKSTGSKRSISARYALTAFTISRNCSVGSAVPEKCSLNLSDNS